MTKKQLEERIVELERRIATLEARPVYQPLPLTPMPYQQPWISGTGTATPPPRPPYTVTF